MPRQNQKKDNRDSDSRPSLSSPESSEESRKPSSSSRSHGSSDRNSRGIPKTLSEIWGQKKTPRDRNERERQSSKSEGNGSSSSKRTHFIHHPGGPKPRSMWDVISTIVNSPKPKKRDERRGYWIRGYKGTMMSLEKPGESSRRADHKKPKRGERSPSEEYDASEAGIGAPLQPSRNAPRNLGELKPPAMSRVIVDGDGVVDENDNFTSIKGKITTESNFFVVITESYSMLVNIPIDWEYITIIEKIEDVYYVLAEYRASHPTAPPGCMWLIKGVYNDHDENGLASLVNVHRYQFLTELITNTSDFDWYDGILQHGSFVVEKGGEVNDTFSIGVFAQPDGLPRLQVTDFEGTRYLGVDSNESIPRTTNSKKGTNPLSGSDKNTSKTINSKNGTKPTNGENGINPFDYLDKNTSETINGEKGTNPFDYLDKNDPEPTNDENGTNLLDDPDKIAPDDKKSRNCLNTDENTQNKATDGNNKEDANASSFNPDENTPKTTLGGGKKGAKRRLKALNKNKKDPPKATIEDDEN